MVDYLEESGVAFLSIAEPDYRAHNVDGGGGALMKFMEERLEESGAEVYTETPVMSLVVDGERVVGVMADESFSVQTKASSLQLEALPTTRSLWRSTPPIFPMFVWFPAKAPKAEDCRWAWRSGRLRWLWKAECIRISSARRAWRTCRGNARLLRRLS